MFFPEEQEVNDEQAAIWSAKLHTALLKSNKVSKTFTVSSWSKCFVGLRKRVDATLISEVLDWYLRHIGDEFVPLAYAAKSFCDKFEALHRAMTMSEDAPSESIDEYSKKMAARVLTEYSYPVEIAAAMPVLVQRTRKSWGKFCGVCFEYLKDIGTEPTKEQLFLRHWLAVEAPIFVENWFIFLASRYGRLEHYHGPILTLAFKPDSAWFRQSFWRKWSLDWTCHALTFESLLDKLIKEK